MASTVGEQLLKQVVTGKSVWRHSVFEFRKDLKEEGFKAFLKQAADKGFGLDTGWLEGLMQVYESYQTISKIIGSPNGERKE